MDFVEDVARHWENIKKGNVRNGNQTYLLEVPTEFNNTLIVELSNNGNYWNVNTGGVFNKGYSEEKKEVFSRPATATQPTTTGEVTPTAAHNNGSEATEASRDNTSNTSESKGSENSENRQENLQGEGEFNTPQGEARFSAQEAPQNEDLFARAERIAQQYEQQREQQREEAMLKWYLTGNIRIPEDMPNVRQAVKESFKIV